MIDRKEVQEARAAALDVLSLLSGVEQTLKSARNWGFFDMFSRGSFISSMIKHGKIDKAESQLKNVQRGLIRLQKELGDINLSIQGSLNISGFQRFMDIVFDNVISDWMTQSRINDSLREVQYVKDEVQRVIETLDKIDRGLK